MVVCVLSQLKPSELNIFRCGISIGLRPRPFPQLRMKSSSGFILYVFPPLTPYRHHMSPSGEVIIISGIMCVHSLFVFLSLTLLLDNVVGDKCFDLVFLEGDLSATSL